MAPNMKFSRRSFMLMTLALAACKRGAVALELSGSTMGTSYSIIAMDADGSVDQAALQKAVDASLLKTNTQMSNWDATSEVSRFNAAADTDGFSISPELAEVVAAAQDINLASDGQFDVTLGPVIETWGFGAPGVQTQTPTEAQLATALESVGQAERLHLSGTNLSKSHPDTQIYLSSIGKGYGVDQVTKVVKSFGLNDFMVEIGGDLYVSGLNSDGMPWQIGIESPDALTRQAHQIASVSNLGMATSGDYRNYFEQDGTRYSHILDARTGRPITHHTASVTVLAENAMLADAWATALLVLGTERGLQIANERDLAVLFIDRDANAGDDSFATTASKRFITLKA